ncbi:hypothetical protein DFJ73DRAFT_564674 [Zopfochytrium polystomum]|nr:hypothetical protein DFJ73DRAFT_564674 [Zopfochytrium polystomum]
MNLANTCILHFMGNPSHPLFEYAINLKWRHAIFFSGTKKAASSISFPSGSPEAVTESMELRKRNSYWKGMEIGRELNALTEKDIAAIKEFAKNKASLLEEARAFFGSYAIEDGAENQTVDAVCALMESKYKALEDNSGTPFGDSACYPMLMFHLTDTLGYRWSRSQTLVKFCERSLEILKAAPLMDIPGSSERALCWTGEKEVAALKFLTRKFVCGSKAQLSSWWFNTFVDLRIKSSEAMSELTRRFSTIGTEMTRAAHRLRQNYAKQEQLVEQAMALSPGGSALYNAAVLEFVLKFRPDLIVPEHISNRKLPGLFHPEDNGVEVDFVLSSQPEFRPVNFNRLIPWQIEAFRMRFMEEALDSKVPLQRRVVAVSRMMHAWSLSVKDVAGVLLSPSLPQRLMEAILMFLPQMDEPGAAATIAVAPVFLGSELVRTAVFTIKKILATLPQGLTEDLLLSIVPKKKQYMRITAFKELVRVLISFASTSPRLLEALRELWRRENLHSDVRIAFVQNVQPYLLRESGELSTLAWDVCIDCVASPVKLLATAAILLGLEPSSDYWNSTARAELEKRAVTNILAKQDSTNVHIWNNCCDRYLFDILLPLGPQLDELLGTLPPTDKDYSQVEMWRNKAYSIINNYWVVECQSKPRLIPVLRDRLTSAMARASSYTANRGEKDRLMQTLFALISCAATESVWKHSPIPESWITVEECLASLFAAAYDPSTPFKTRLITRDILSTISLSNFYLPTEHLKSRELRDRAQKLFSSTLRSVPGVWPTLRTAQWGRDLAMFRKDLNAVTFELSQPADLIDPAISQRLDALKATADRLIEEAFVAAATGPANGSEVLSPVSCTLEVVKALATAKQADELRVRLMESDVWGRELPGFPAARNTLRLEVVKKLGTESFRSTELAIGFVQSLTAERDCAFLKSNIPDVASWFAGLFNTFREKCLMDIRNPFVRDLKEEDAPLEHLQSIRNEVVRLGKLCEGDKSDPPSAITRLVAQVVNSDPLFFLQHEPTLAMQVMQRDPFGKAFSDWFGMVNRCIKEIDKNNRKEFLQRPYYAVQSMAPLVDRIVHEARTANFETERSRFASLFVTLATTGTRFMFHLATDAVRDYILSKPESALAVAFLGQQVAATVGVEGLAALHVAMREGWAADLNWKVFGDLERTRTGPSLFRMEFEKNEQMAFVQTESSLARRAAFSGSIEAVSRAFVANFEASPLCTQKTVGKLKPLDVTSWELKVAAASSQEGDETAKKRPAVSDSVAMANPSFYFDATLEALHKTITASDLLATAHDKLVIGTAGLFDGAVVGVAASSDEAAKTATTTAKSTSTHAAAAVKKGTVAFGFPVRAIVDAAAQLAREVAPRLERRGLAFAAARARLAAVETLAQLQRATAASTFAVAPLLAPRKRRPVNAAAALVDALLAEAAVPSDPPADAVAAAAAAAAVASKAGAADAADTAAPATRWMRVEGFQELVEELAMSADDRVYKVAASIEDAAWKLRWEVEA